MPEQTVAPKDLVVITELQYAKVMTRIKDLCTDIRSHLIEVAGLLGQMSRPMLQKAKADLKCFNISAEWVERLALAGRNEIPKWLGMGTKTLPLSMLRRLEPQARKDISDPKATVEVVTPRGVRIKRLEDCNPVELHQSIDPSKGRLSATEQRRRMLAFAPPEPKSIKNSFSPEHLGLFDGMQASPDKPDTVILYWRDREDPPHTRKGGIEVSLSQLRKLV